MVDLESLMVSWRADEGGRSVAVAEGTMVYVLGLYFGGDQECWCCDF